MFKAKKPVRKEDDGKTIGASENHYRAPKFTIPKTTQKKKGAKK
jgi:hypothetical protein